MKNPLPVILLLLIGLSVFTLRDAARQVIPVEFSGNPPLFRVPLAWNVRHMEKPVLFMALAYLYLVRWLEMLRRDAESVSESSEEAPRPNNGEAPSEGLRPE